MKKKNGQTLAETRSRKNNRKREFLDHEIKVIAKLRQEHFCSCKLSDFDASETRNRRSRLAYFFDCALQTPPDDIFAIKNFPAKHNNL